MAKILFAHPEFVLDVTRDAAAAVQTNAATADGA